MDENLRKLIMEVCNDWMSARMPMTEAMHSAFLESTGDRGKYPNALDTLARLALERPNVKVTGDGRLHGRRPGEPQG